jgi:hypothetical protein
MHTLTAYTRFEQLKEAKAGFGYYVHSADKRMLSYIQ